MKIRISIILMIVLLMINSTVFSSVNDFDNNIMKTIDSDELKEIAYVVSSTIEIDYKNNSGKKQIEKINKVLSRSNYDYYLMDKSEIKANYNKQKINISVSESNDSSNIDVIYTKEGTFTDNEIKEISNDLIKYSDSNYNNSFIWSNTIKYKITGNNKMVLQYINDKLNSIKLTKYTQGIFGTGYIKDTKISFAIANYDSGSYLIIGTPIINIAY